MQYRRRLPRFLLIIGVAVGVVGVSPAIGEAKPAYASPGIVISTGRTECTLGITGDMDGVAYGVTAAHCFEAGKAVYSGRQRSLIGWYEHVFGNDQTTGDLGFALIKLAPGAITYTVGTAHLAPRIGQSVCHFGATTAETCGKVTHVERNYFLTDFHSEKGDSGSIVYQQGPGGPNDSVDFLGILIGTGERGVIVESAKYLRDTIRAQTGGNFEFHSA